MPTVNLSGTPNVRFPDPRIKRVAPDGTQEYSAYQALFIWYWPTPPDGLPAGYYVGLTGMNAGGNDLWYLLFGSDYPAICNITSTYSFGGYFSDGTINQFKNMTFNETAASSLSGASNFCPLLQNGQSFIGQEAYKRILTGPTLTNGVTVSGFNQFTLMADHGLYSGASGGAVTTTQPDLTLRADVVLNSATVHSTSPYFGVQEGVDAEGDPTILPQIFRQPVILWEPDLTQKIVDDGYTITVDSQLCGPTVFDVVGIWSIGRYSPVPAPPALMGARSFAAPSSGMSVADEALLARGVAALESLREQVKRRK